MILAELVKQVTRPRTWLVYAALALFVVAIAVVLSATGAGRIERVGDIPLLVTPSVSGLSIPVIALASTMKFFLPLAVAVFAGESVVGDASSGSLRYALARPASRSSVLASKLVVALLLSLVAVMVIPVVGLIAGLIAFGAGPFSLVDGRLSTASHAVLASFSFGAGSGRMALGTAYVAAGMTSVFAFAFFISTISRRPLAAVASGVGLTIISRVLNSDYLPGVAVLNPYMPNNDVDLWQHLFQQPAVTHGMVRFLVLQVVYVAVFLSAAWLVFSRRDILT